MAAVLKLEILAYAPTAFFHCQGCELLWEQTGFSRGVRKEQLQSGLPPEMLQEYARVSDWARRLLAAHGDRIALEVIDVASVRGFWKALRHGIHRYPAVIIGGRGGRRRFVVSELGAAEEAVARRLSAAPRA